jgi:hypothetical protein
MNTEDSMKEGVKSSIRQIYDTHQYLLINKINIMKMNNITVYIFIKNFFHLLF